MARKRDSEIVKALHANDLGYQQCEWESAGERCRYPGSMSTNTHEGGPYFCREHFACKDPMWGATVVEASRDYRHVEPGGPEYLAAATQKAKAALEGSGMARQPGESFDAYRKRCVRFVKESKLMRAA